MPKVFTKRQNDLFWNKVPVQIFPKCWNWQGYIAVNRGGYGVFKVWGSPQRVHRLMWWLITHQWPADKYVLHKCDNPPCVNPDHLFLGTAQDNVDDMRAKGRQNYAYGELQGGAKLTDTQVRTIRKMSGTHMSLANKFGVHQSTITRIINYKRRKRYVS